MLSDYGERTGEQSNALLSQLPQLFTRLLDQFLQLLNTQVALFKTELRAGVKEYAKGFLLAACAAVLALMGFLLLSVGLALGLNLYLQSPAFSFVLVGLIYLLVGSVAGIIWGKKLISQPALLTQTVRELERDRQWIKTGTRQVT
jgi:uncharacterized membrane protein YqjE